MPQADDFVFECFSGGRSLGIRDESSHYRVGDPEAWRQDLSGDLVEDIRARYHALLARYYPEAL